MWSSEEGEWIQSIARRIMPLIKTFAIPTGLQVQEGPEAVVKLLKEKIPEIIDLR